MRVRMHCRVEQIIITLIAPPIVAGLCWLQSRGWRLRVQSGELNDESTSRQKDLFWIVLAALYVVSFGVTFYKWNR